MNDAEAYRLQQARELLRSLGFVEQEDGTFRKPAPEQPDRFAPRRIDPDNPATCEACE